MKTLNETLEEIESRANAAKIGELFPAESAVDVPRLLAMVRLAISQRNRRLECEWDLKVRDKLAAQLDAELLKLAGGE